MGSINAGWADMGLHPETFWLGYATSAAAAWHPGAPDPAESMAAFYPLFYGHRVSQMDRVYQLMSTQAQFWSDSWETSPSSARKPIWGNSNGPFEQPRPARDQSIPLPPVPAADLGVSLRMGGAECRPPAIGGRVSGGERRTVRAASRQSVARRSEFLQPGSLSLHRASLPAESGNAAGDRAHGGLAAIGCRGGRQESGEAGSCFARSNPAASEADPVCAQSSARGCDRDVVQIVAAAGRRGERPALSASNWTT